MVRFCPLFHQIGLGLADIVKSLLDTDLNSPWASNTGCAGVLK